MLKIYLCELKYELQDENRIIHLSTNTHYEIADEVAAVPKTIEFGAYTEEAANVYVHSCELRETKKGIKAEYWTWEGTVYAKEWIAPNVKLVVHIAYKESSCSMKRLMELPAPDVIAYLKQEGLNLTMPS